MLRFSHFTRLYRGSRSRLRKTSCRPSLAEVLEARCLLDAAPYVELNLAASRPNTALVTDPSLTFASGIATSPGTSGGFSVSDNLLGQSKGYSGDVAGSPFVAAGENAQVPLAMGQVYNGNTNEFFITSPPPPPGMEIASIRAPAEFLYSSLDGSIYGFNSQIGQEAVAAVSMKNTVFTGIAIANNGTADQLYATDVLGGKIDVFDTSFSPVTTSGSFTDPNLPKGYRPFNIEALGGDLYVSYVAPAATPMETSNGLPVGLTSGGVVDVFDADGNFLGRIASGSSVDQPWGMAIAPASFGQFAGDLLVANHGDGKITAFDPTPDKTATTGTPLGTLSDASGNAFAIDGLWGLSFGNGDNAGDTNALYFAAGTLPLIPAGANESAGSSAIAVPLTHGLFGTIQVAGTDPLVAVGTKLTANSGETLSSVLAAFGSADTSSPTATATSGTMVSPVATYSATIDWGDGSTSAGTVVSTGNGGYLVVGTHSYSADGSDNYSVTINDTNGNTATATGTVEVSTATLSATALTVQSQGLAVNGATVATFVDSGGADPLTNYSATIDWGDGSSASVGTVTPGIMPLDAFPVGGGYFNVAGSHTYAATGAYTFTVTIDDSDGSTATVQGTVDVVPATLQATALPVISNGLTVNNAMVADFVDTGGSDPLSNFTATIDWGDGASSAGTIVAGMITTGGTGTGTAVPSAAPQDFGAFYGVSGSHAYAAAGDYTFTVTIDDSDGISTNVTGTVEASQPTLVAKGLTITGTGLAVDKATVADIIDTGGSDPLTNFTATIDWGDGTSTTGTVSGGSLIPGSPNGRSPIVAGAIYYVAGSHTYAATGDYTTTITISDSDGTSATVSGAVDLAAATLEAHALPVTSHGLNVDNAAVADFADTGTDPLSNYSATINWGDGSSSAATIGPGVIPLDGKDGIPGGLFDVTGSHSYAATGTYTFTVTISDSDGTSATVTGTADVTPATLEAKAVPVVTSGLAVSATVADFVDTDGGDPLTNYSATINWGDGTPSSTGTISVIILDSGTGQASPTAMPPIIIGGKIYSVEGTHTYAATGDYTTTITISDSDGTSATVTGSVSVSQPTLHAHALSVISQGLNVNNAAVADFRDTVADPLSNYSATIDWGDGASSAGTIGPGVIPLGAKNGFPAGHFDVTGSHSYASAGTYTFTVTISDSDGTSATVTGTVDVTTATLEAKAVPVVTSGLAVNATVANFVDTDGGDPLTNYSATINWGDGTPSSTGTISVIILDSGTGQASPAAMPPVIIGGKYYSIGGSHTYAATGDYTTTITISDTDGTSATVTGSVSVSQPTLKATALSVSSQGLNVHSGVVAEFVDTGGTDPVSNYSATINWGDNSTSSGTILLPVDPVPGVPSVFHVAGSHTYASPGDYTFTVIISDTDGTSATVTGTDDVAEPTLKAKALPVTSQGLSVNKQTVADFIDTGGPDSLSNYTATIDWGDNSTSAGTITELAAGATAAGDPLTAVPGGILNGIFFEVAGSHTYAAAGNYTFTVTINDTDGTSATVTGTVAAAEPTLDATAVPVVSQGLNVNKAILADFTDTGGADPLSNYSATIDWGDGSSSTGTIGGGGITLPGGGIAATSGADVNPGGPIIFADHFAVSGSHSYASAGTYTFTVTISDTDGTSATVTGTVDVAEPTLKAKALPVTSQGLSVNKQTVADFIDTGGPDSLSNYTATIDWGDNSTSAGTITELAAGGTAAGGPLTAVPGGILNGIFFEVAGSHTYAAAGNYTFTVTISDSDGTSATVTGTASAATPTLEAKVLPVYSPSVTLTNATVANFADTGGADPLSNYSATINWGDGSSATAGTVTGGIMPGAGAAAVFGSFFSVAGSHTYTAAGDYTLTVTISDSDGTSTTVTGTASVAQAPLLAVGVPVVVNSGLSVNNAIVAALTDAAGGDNVSNYSATIDWGDGSSATAGTVTGSGNSFVVNGSHTYAASGDYQVTVSIADSDGSKATVTAHAFVEVPLASYVANAFEGILHRAADDSGLSYWSQQIAGGLAPAQFANDLTHSAEFYATNVIEPDYQEYLGRSADTSGIGYWTSQMQQGLTDQQIEANFIASDEFFAKAGGTDAGWVNAMYQTVLGRPADSSGLSYWLSQMASGVSRADVAMGFAASQEREGQIIQQDYFSYLGRSASADEINYWVAQFDNGATNEDIVSGFVGSPEYVKLHS